MNIKNLVLGIGIVVVFALALWQGVEAFYPSPQYNDFCGNVEPRVSAGSIAKENIDFYENQTICLENDGEWRNGYCDYYSKCSDEWNDARDDYSKVVFFVALIVGVLALIVGYSILSIEPVGSALMASGIWSFFWGTVINWRNFSDIWRFLLLALALVLLIWIAVRLNTSNKKGFFRKILGK